jgi:hypothetical protein
MTSEQVKGHTPGLLEGALSAKDRGDLIRLADALHDLPSTAHPAIAARVLAEGLMLPKGLNARIVTWSAKLICWRRKIDRYSAYAILFVSPRGMAVATETFEQTVHWLVYGRDTSMKGSMGGFNQAELDKLCRMHDLAAISRTGAA